MVPPQPLGCGPQEGPPEQATGTHPLVNVSGWDSGACPGAPSVAVMLTTVFCGIEFAAWMLSVPWSFVQLPGTNGCPLAMMDARVGSLLVR